MTRLLRISAGSLGLLLGAQAIGKLVDMRLYAAALERFHAFPRGWTKSVAVIWVVVELVAFVALGLTAIRPVRAVFLVGAAAAATDALAYAALTIGTKLRGIEVFNCTCFGAFLPQRLSGFVLAQDVAMVGWTLWMLWRAVRDVP